MKFCIEPMTFTWLAVPPARYAGSLLDEAWGSRQVRLRHQVTVLRNFFNHGAPGARGVGVDDCCR